jgi:hypothetical protein
VANARARHASGRAGAAGCRRCGGPASGAARRHRCQRAAFEPLTDRDADELLHEIRGLPLLQGYRGRAPADIDALGDLLLRVSRLPDDVPEIVELDLNPVMALPEGHGCLLVDARI